VGYRAVIFDLGGVVVPSPLDAFRAYEEANGLPPRFVSEVVVRGGDDGAWARFERSDVTYDEFVTAFEGECAASGGRVAVGELLGSIRAGRRPHPEMLAAIGAIRARGLKAGALTNNWTTPEREGALATVREYFDDVVESSVEGLRKPDPRIYLLACERLDVEPSETVFLDDLGANLKPARALGMTTIKVTDPAGAIADLERTLGFSLAP